MTILIDANVFLDYVASREPFYADAYKIINLCHTGKVNGYIAFHSVSIIWYTLRKFIPDNSERRSWLRAILQTVQVTSASHKEVLKAVEMIVLKILKIVYNISVQNQLKHSIL